MTDRADLLIDSRCRLGEGPLWHPDRQELFWFDIERCRFFRADASGSVLNRWAFAEPVSAAAIVDARTLLLAGASALILFDIETGAQTPRLPLEADRPGNRANDARVAPGGTFWIGTMSLKGEEEPGAGAIHGFRAGRLERLVEAITIPNSICFSPDGGTAYFADTPTGRILSRPIEPETGLPTGPAVLFADTSDLPGFPDGSVVDAEGFLWNARWGGGAVLRFSPEGILERTVSVPVPNATCPAFGGPDLKTLFITTAGGDEDGAPPHAGGVFAVELDIAGQPEPRIAL